MTTFAKGLFSLLGRAKNYALQFVLGHRLVPARPEGLVVTTIASVAEFENCFEQLLQTYVNGTGQVDYEALAAPGPRQALSNVVQFIAVRSPVSHPQFFDTQAKQLAFYINAYNALVLWGVVNNWPLTSVRNASVWAIVKLAPVQPFFIGLHFEVAGYANIGRGGLNLFDLEHKIIRPYGDARIHAAINCASGGCPRLRQTAFRHSSLDEDLDECMVEMVTDSRHLRVDDARCKITCSMIFKWYYGDFVGPSQATSLWAYWMRFLTPRHHHIQYMACSEQYTVEYEAYDWTINSQGRAQTSASEASRCNTDGHLRHEDGKLRQRAQ